jgi:hypothetical protein
MRAIVEGSRLLIFARDTINHDYAIGRKDAV